MADRRRPRSPHAGREFKSYALAIGQLVLIWNQLHDTLGLMYALSNKGPPNDDRSYGRAFAIWGIGDSERNKRKMLDTALDWIPKDNHSKFPELTPDIRWIMERANALEDRRNDVVHAPLTLIASPFLADLIGLKVGDVHPTSLNSRARKLAASIERRGVPLLDEIKLYRDYADLLSQFATQVLLAWQHPDEFSWPNKPALPPLGEGKKNQGSHKPATPPSRPRSSRA